MGPRPLATLLVLILACARSEAQPRAVSVPVTSLNPTRQKVEEAPLADVHTAVSFIDSPLPLSMVRTRFDWARDFRQPSRAEQFMNLPGFPLPENRLDYQELRTRIEYGLDTFFSTFVETPFRWLDPERNPNDHGVGDTTLGFKTVLFNDAKLLTTFQLRATFPTSSRDHLGTNHVGLEPGLLLGWRPMPYLNVESEVRYDIPLGGKPNAGDVLRYGVGVSYGQRSAGEIWVMPVVEAVGWSVLDGNTLAPLPGGAFAVEDARATIFNVFAGFRLGFGSRADLYTGYGRSLTGPAWSRDIFRVEFRLFY